MVKRKWRGRRPAGEQSRKLTQNDQAPERPGSPPQQVETEAQPAETLNATQVDQKRHPSRRQHRKKKREEQKGAETVQRHEQYLYYLLVVFQANC